MRMCEHAGLRRCEHANMRMHEQANMRICEPAPFSAQAWIKKRARSEVTRFRPGLIGALASCPHPAGGVASWRLHVFVDTIVCTSQVLD